MVKFFLAILLISLQGNSFGSNQLPDFTVHADSRKNTVLIQWQNKSDDIKMYILQHSLDNTLWQDMALQAINQNTEIRSFYFVDKKATTGFNYYRLKCMLFNGLTEFTQSKMVNMAGSLNNWILYPVPVTDWLTIDYRGNEPLKGVVHIVIQQSSGRIITRLRSASCYTHIRIPVNNLGKGIYDIRIIVQGIIVWDQRVIK